MGAKELRTIAALAGRRAKQRAALEATDTAFREAIRAAFDAGETAGPIAKVAGLTPPRIYQIRDSRR
jgi:hypothetical protein